jgi:hypothetical protein
MERCPNCRARTDGTDTCRRCGMALGLLAATERAAEHWLRRGIGHLAAGAPQAAARALERSLALRRDPLAEQLLGLAPGLLQQVPASSAGIETPVGADDANPGSASNGALS